MGNVYVFYIASICIHGEELLRHFAFHQKYRRSHNETDVRHIWKIDNRTIRRDLWNKCNELGRLFMEVFIFGRWWRRHQSLAHKGLGIFRFCIMPWKDEREPTIKYCMGRQVDVVQEFITIQNFGHNWQRTDGIRMEYFPRFTTLQLIDKVQEFMNKMGDPSQYQGRVIFTSTFKDIIWRSTDNELHTRDTIRKKFSSRTLVIHRTWIRNKVVFHIHWQTTRRMGERLKLFFAQLFLLISSVSTEQSQICKNGETRTWQVNLTHCLCQQVYWRKHLHLRPMILRKKIYCKSTKNEWKCSHNKIVWLRFVLMQDSTSWQRTLKNSHNSQNQWHVVSTPCQEMKKKKNIWPERLDSSEHKNGDRVGSHNQLFAR